MLLSKTLLFALMTCAGMFGYYLDKPPIINKEVIEYVYERDCYLEFEEREYKAKPLTIKDLEAL